MKAIPARRLTARRLTCLAASLLALLIGAPACSRQAASESPAETRTAAVFPTATHTPSPMALPTATPSPTPIAPAIIFSDQELAGGEEVVVELAALPEAGWVAIYASDGDDQSPIGYAPVPAGVSRDMAVAVDLSRVTSALQARLHADQGEAGVFEYPGPDQALPTQASARIALPTPEIVVSDQAIAEDGLVLIDRAYMPRPGWLLVHATAADGSAGPVVGRLFLEEGLHEGQAASIRWREGTPELTIVVHEDAGRPGKLDYPDDDLPVLVDGEPVTASFKATYPPDILVYDQPIVNGEVVVERVISEGPGWLAVYADDGGQPGLIIGSAPVVPGLNRQVAVTLAAAAATSQLFVRLHGDAEPDDNFNPSVDMPVRYLDRLPEAARFRTDAGGYLVAADQVLGDNNVVTIALAVSPGPGWVVIHEDADGAPGRVLGRRWLPAGVTRNLSIELDASPSGDFLFAMLHQDAGVPRELDFPVGADAPLQSAGKPVQVRFSISPAERDS